ncbi:MAG: universal stress protein [Bacteroidota bacterium]
MAKQILVPTDFSSCAQCAADLAMEMASTIGAEVHFYTHVEQDSYWGRLTGKSKSQERQTLDKVNTQFSALKQRYKDKMVRISTSHSYESIDLYLTKYLRREQVGLVVLGTYGQSGVGEYMWGSETNKVARVAEVPVLIVKQPLPTPDFSHVLFVSDFQYTAKSAFEQMLEILQPYDSTLHLIEITGKHGSKTPEFQDQVAPFVQMAGSKHCVAYSISKETPGPELSRLVDQLQAQMVVIPNYLHPMRRISSSKIIKAASEALTSPVMTLNLR